MPHAVTIGPDGIWDNGYHVVFYPKYRRLVLVDDIADHWGELIREKAAECGWQVVALKAMPNHVHLFVKAWSKNSPSFVANQFKGFTSRMLRSEFPSLRSGLPTL